MKSDETWATTFVILAATAAGAAATIAEDGRGWGAATVRALLVAAVGFIVIAGVFLVQIGRARPKLRWAGPALSDSYFGGDTRQAHFVRIWVQNAPSRGHDAALDVWATLRYIDRSGKQLAEIPGRWAHLATAPTWSENHVPPVAKLLANEITYPLDITFRIDGTATLFAYNDLIQMEGPFSQPLGCEAVDVEITLRSSNAGPLKGTFQIAGDPPDIKGPSCG